jgi:hypothetical protein
MDRNRTNEPRGRVTQAEKAEPMPHDMLTQAIANLEEVAAEIRKCAGSAFVGGFTAQCWADKVLTAVSDLKEVEASPPREPSVSSEDLAWLREYSLTSAIAADQDFCVGAEESQAANAQYERASRLFNQLAALLSGSQSGDVPVGK